MLRHLRAMHDDNHAQQVNASEVSAGYPDCTYYYHYYYILNLNISFNDVVIMILEFIPLIVSRKQKLDEALVDMIVKDGQPFCVVEDEGFRKFVCILDPTYAILGRKAMKAMVDVRYEKTREKAIAEVKKASAVSLTANMYVWLRFST